MSQQHTTSPVTNIHRIRYVRGLLRVLFLPVCLVAALTFLAPGVLQTMALSEYPEGILPFWKSLFSFDAPACSTAVFMTGTEESREALGRITRPAEEVVMLDDWNYTAFYRGRPSPSKFR